MHDLNFIRENPKEFDLELKRRDFEPKAKLILDLDKKVREQKQLLQDLNQEKNIIAKEIGQAKAQNKDASEFFKKAEEIKKKIAELDGGSEEEKELNKILLGLPNILSSQVPEGEKEEDNKEVKKWGEPKKFDFEAQQHFDLGEKLGVIDFEQAAKISGARFAIIKNELARLERVLANFMLDMLTQEFGFEEVSPPYLVSQKSMIGSGQLPKFAEDAFVTTDNRWLVPTSEVSLVNLVQDKILKEEELPVKYTAYTPCFRSEAGSAGKDTRGMIRMHQFSKVEMVVLAAEEKSEEIHEQMLGFSEEILKRLELPYRVMLLCTKDTGFTSSKTYDLEVWLPGQDAYREISSISNCKSFQARRMKARYKTAEKQNKFLHSLNGSALAVGRTLVAILENYQNKDGSITIPKALRASFGKDKIG